MSQKSSVPQAISFVSQVLKRDTGLNEQKAGQGGILSCFPEVTHRICRK